MEIRLTIYLDPYLAQRELVAVERPVIFDVGAHVGQTAAQYRKLFPEGALQLLAAQQIVIYMGMIMAPTYVGQHDLKDYLGLLSSHGYLLFDFYNPVRKDARLIQSDLIFVSAALLDKYECARASSSVR